MALPTKSDLETMEFSFTGEPFVDVPGNSSIDLMTMDWSYLGEPFVRNPSGNVLTSAKMMLLGVGG